MAQQLRSLAAQQGVLALRRQRQGIFRSLRAAWSTEQVPEQLGSHRETLFQKTKQNNNNKVIETLTI